ncbi:MAG: MarR family transcriptional regulator [Actinobacteria bacterium]|uniref:Unannotated protein n=1 Tax=freshwater metagenome TaxID=449393 RepID=A0A6J7SFZ0_9ZZZZ|nr:MarR family transcriptional regulator [Actinomycetota bacterium]MSV85045.1 MarR family transcriptional regulator [Actinomycetota bacterium]MSX75022.1 MarR family transcriptional regulator [Actinomycetota bacterium]MTA75222.1 MarR family transcriptional regulator [Actinomycetota bacterium]
MEPNWLNEREARAWRGYQGMRISLGSHLARHMSSECLLTEAEFEILVNVSEAPERTIRSRDLCSALAWERSRLSHQLSRMESRGLISREPCLGDARGFNVLLTDAGLAAIEAAAPKHLVEVRRSFVDVLTDEQLDSFGDIAETIITHLAGQEENERCGDSPI